MLELFVKLCLIITTINVFIVALYGGMFVGAASPLLQSLPASIKDYNTITGAEEITTIPISATDINSAAEITSGVTLFGIKIPYVSEFLGSVGWLLNLFSNVLVGPFMWLPAIFPAEMVAIAYAIATPFFIIQAIGFLYLFSLVLSGIGAIISRFTGG